MEMKGVRIAYLLAMSRFSFRVDCIEKVIKMSEFDQVIARIDEVNAGDPKRDVHEGKEYPKEQIYGIRMMAWVERLDSGASDALLIAARAQHIRRWEIARDTYPAGKSGYYAWRTFLYGFHGEKAGEIMRGVGYGEDVIAEMQAIMQKKNLKTNAGTQTLEDAAALVFLENHFLDFAGRDDMNDDKLVDILRKTWDKMSDVGHDAALKLVLPDAAAALVAKALGV
jgi:hypothetical protein